MPFYDSEAIEQARRVDLLTYLQTCEPQELVHVSGNVYCTKTHDSLRISNGKWCWFSRGIGGYSALDYLIILLVIAFLISPYGLPMAAIWLLGKVQDLKFIIQDLVYG